MAAAVATAKQMHLNLPTIPVAHSAKLKTNDVNQLTIQAQPVAPAISEGGKGKPGTTLPTVHMSMGSLTSKPKQPGFVGRSLTSVSLMSGDESSNNKRSELKSSWLKANDVKNPFKYTVEELNEIVQEKLSSGFHGLKHLFKSQTAHGNCVVSRDALHKILISICGYISKDLFDRYLKRLRLQHAQYISFEMFIAKFPDNEAVKKEWLMPISQAKICEEESRYKEQQLRRPAVISSNLAYAPYFLVFLRDLVKNRKFKPELHLPDGVRDGEEELLKVHLRRIVTMLANYDITDSELDKLWLKFDSRGVGSASLDEFYKVIRYNPASQKALFDVRQESSMQVKVADVAPQTFSVMEEERPVAEDIGTAREECGRPILKSNYNISKKLKGLDSVIEELLYNLDLPALNMMAAFKQFDALEDNFVPKISFREVLKEFGFPIGALDMDTFLSRNCLRVLNGLMEYKDFIQRFTNKEYYGLVNRIVNDTEHIFNKEPLNRLRRQGSGSTDWSAEEVEGGLVEYFMGSYIKLITSLRKADKSSSRFLPADNVKPALEKILGREFKSHEWKHLLSVVGVSEDGLIPYENIIAVLNKRQPFWNQTAKLGHKVTVIARPATTLELERLREGVRKEKTMHTHLSPLDHLRSLNDMSTAIRELMKTRFRSLDYAYRYQDRRMTGRLDKDMLRRILRECGLDFEQKEIEKLWSTFALAPDGLYTWSKFCQRYCNDTTKLKQAGQSETQKEETSLTSAEDLQASNGGRACSVASQAPTRATTTRSKITDPILTILQSEVRTKYGELESLYKRLDPQGRGHVTTFEAVEGFKSLKFNIKPEEVQHICKLFDLENSSRFHYKPFLSSYKVRTSQSRQRLPSQTAPPAPPSFVRPGSRLLKNRLVHQLNGRGPEMRRQFKKSDPLGQGVLSFRDFKLCLNLLGVNCSGDESFSEVASLFDHNLRGQINYEEFSALCLSQNS